MLGSSVMSVPVVPESTGARILMNRYTKLAITKVITEAIELSNTFRKAIILPLRWVMCAIIRWHWRIKTLQL